VERKDCEERSASAQGRIAIRVKSLTWFLLKFLIVAAIVAPIWYFYVGHGYNQVLTKIMNIGVQQNYRYILEKDKLYLVRFSEAKSPETAVTLNIFTLNFNVIPFLSLFLIMPSTPWRRRILYIAIGFTLLSMTHYVHAKLDIYVQMHKEVQIEPGSLSSYGNYLWQRFILYLRSFMEQAGSMLMPFFLWLLFFNKQVLTFASKRRRNDVPTTDITTAEAASAAEIKKTTNPSSV
jgi:hypothetical protein